MTNGKLAVAASSLSRTHCAEQNAAFEMDDLDESDGTAKLLSLVFERASRSMPNLNTGGYLELRRAVNDAATHLTEASTKGERLSIVRTVLGEFEGYRERLDTTLLEAEANWRNLAVTLFRELLKSTSIDPSSFEVASIFERIKRFTNADDLHDISARIQDLLQSTQMQLLAETASPAGHKNRFGIREDATGLRGRAAAIEYLNKILVQRKGGFVVIFRLNCLDIIGQRFGWNALQDSIMTVSAFLLAHLNHNDTIYRWNDSALLAIIQGPTTEQIVTASLERIVNKNRYTLIQLEDRKVMLRIPLSFTLIPISRISRADDLYRIFVETEEANGSTSTTRND